jgi:hypothetical protein
LQEKNLRATAKKKTAVKTVGTSGGDKLIAASSQSGRNLYKMMYSGMFPFFFFLKGLSHHIFEVFL